MDDPTQAYTNKVLAACIAKICKAVGYDTISSRALELFVDVVHTYIRNICVSWHDYSELFEHTEPRLHEFALVMRDLNVSVQDLFNYLDTVPPVNLNYQVPMYPVPSTSNLNFLKPGSKEMLVRPVHIHEHLPPMYSQDDFNIDLGQDISSLDSLPHNVLSVSSPSSTSVAANQLLLAQGDYSHLLPISRKLSCETSAREKELVSVMMTTSGFLSHAREGKLPDNTIPECVVRSYRRYKRNEHVELRRQQKRIEFQNTGVKRDVQKMEKSLDQSQRQEKREFELDQQKINKQLMRKILGPSHPSPPIKKFNEVSNLHSAYRVKLTSTAITRSLVDTHNHSHSEVAKLPTEPDKEKLSILKRISKVRDTKFDKTSHFKEHEDKNEKISHASGDFVREKKKVMSHMDAFTKGKRMECGFFENERVDKKADFNKNISDKLKMKYTHVYSESGYISEKMKDTSKALGITNKLEKRRKYKKHLEHSSIISSKKVMLEESSGSEDGSVRYDKKNDTVKTMSPGSGENKKNIVKHVSDDSSSEPYYDSEKKSSFISKEKTVKLDPVKLNSDKARKISSIFLKRNQMKDKLKSIHPSECELNIKSKKSYSSDSDDTYISNSFNETEESHEKLRVRDIYESSSEESSTLYKQNSARKLHFKDDIKIKPSKKIKTKHSMERNKELQYISSLSSDDDSVDYGNKVQKGFKAKNKGSKGSQTKKHFLKNSVGCYEQTAIGRSNLINSGTLKRKRGRPKKIVPLPIEEVESEGTSLLLNEKSNDRADKIDASCIKIPKKRGRPRKVIVLTAENPEQSIDTFEIPLTVENPEKATDSFVTPLTVENPEQVNDSIEIPTDTNSDNEFTDNKTSPLYESHEQTDSESCTSKTKRGRPPKISSTLFNYAETQESKISKVSIFKPKSKRGRPRKIPVSDGKSYSHNKEIDVLVPKKRGRPRKFQPVPLEHGTLDQATDSDILAETSNGEVESVENSVEVSDKGYDGFEMQQLKEQSDDINVENKNMCEPVAGNIESTFSLFSNMHSAPGLIPSFIPSTQLFPPKFPISFPSLGKITHSTHPAMPDLQFPPPSMMQTKSGVSHTNTSLQLKSSSLPPPISEHSHSSVLLKPSVLDVTISDAPSSLQSLVPDDKLCSIESVESGSSEHTKIKKSAEEKRIKKARKKLKKEKKERDKKKKSKKHRKKGDKHKRHGTKKSKDKLTSAEAEECHITGEKCNMIKSEGFNVIQSSSCIKNSVNVSDICEPYIVKSISSIITSSKQTEEAIISNVVTGPKNSPPLLMETKCSEWTPKDKHTIMDTDAEFSDSFAGLQPPIKTKASMKFIPEIIVKPVNIDGNEGKCCNEPVTAKIELESTNEVQNNNLETVTVDSNNIQKCSKSHKSKIGKSTAYVKTKKDEKHKKSKKNVAAGKQEPNQLPHYIYNVDGIQIWICPSCQAQDDGTPMIACDRCDAWYHWSCVGINSSPESDEWFCPACLV